MGVRFYGQKAFNNIFYAMAIQIENHFAQEFFDGDLTRIVVASNEFAFRARSSGQPWNNLYLPFMNYRLRNVPTDVTTGWKNAGHMQSGIYIPELEEKWTLFPVTLEYEATFFAAEGYDLDYAFQQAVMDDEIPTFIEPILRITRNQGTPEQIDYDVRFPGQMDFTNLQYEPTYNEAEWLRQNKIRSFSMDFKVQTMLTAGSSDFWIPTEVVFDFASKRNLAEDPTDYQETLNLVVDHLNGTVTEELPGD